jgi:hypothetical protein
MSVLHPEKLTLTCILLLEKWHPCYGIYVINQLIFTTEESCADITCLFQLRIGGKKS